MFCKSKHIQKLCLYCIWSFPCYQAIRQNTFPVRSNKHIFVYKFKKTFDCIHVILYLLTIASTVWLEDITKHTKLGNHCIQLLVSHLKFLIHRCLIQFLKNHFINDLLIVDAFFYMNKSRFKDYIYCFIYFYLKFCRGGMGMNRSSVCWLVV